MAQHIGYGRYGSFLLFMLLGHPCGSAGDVRPRLNSVISMHHSSLLGARTARKSLPLSKYQINAQGYNHRIFRAGGLSVSVEFVFMNSSFFSLILLQAMLDGFAQHPEQYVGLTTKPGYLVLQNSSDS